MLTPIAPQSLARCRVGHVCCQASWQRWIRDRSGCLLLILVPLARREHARTAPALTETLQTCPTQRRHVARVGTVTGKRPELPQPSISEQPPGPVHRVGQLVSGRGLDGCLLLCTSQCTRVHSGFKWPTLCACACAMSGRTGRAPSVEGPCDVLRSGDGPLSSRPPPSRTGSDGACWLEPQGRRLCAPSPLLIHTRLAEDPSQERANL